MGILHLQERQRVRLFVRRDAYGRFFSCLVFVPRDRYNTRIGRRCRKSCSERSTAPTSSSTSASESVLARLHFIVYVAPGENPDYDASAIEERLAEATRSWTDNLYEALIEHFGEEQEASSSSTSTGTPSRRATVTASCPGPPWRTSPGSRSSNQRKT